MVKAVKLHLWQDKTGEPREKRAHDSDSSTTNPTVYTLDMYRKHLSSFSASF